MVLVWDTDGELELLVQYLLGLKKELQIADGLVMERRWEGLNLLRSMFDIFNNCLN